MTKTLFAKKQSVLEGAIGKSSAVEESLSTLLGIEDL